MAKSDYLKSLMRDLESHTEVRRFGSGWLSGFFGLLFAISGFFMILFLHGNLTQELIGDKIPRILADDLLEFPRRIFDLALR